MIRFVLNWSSKEKNIQKLNSVLRSFGDVEARGTVHRRQNNTGEEDPPLGNYTHRLCKDQGMARDRPQTQIACRQTASMRGLPFVQNGNHESSMQAPFKRS